MDRQRERWGREREEEGEGRERTFVRGTCLNRSGSITDRCDPSQYLSSAPPLL